MWSRNFYDTLLASFHAICLCSEGKCLLATTSFLSRIALKTAHIRERSGDTAGFLEENVFKPKMQSSLSSSTFFFFRAGSRESNSAIVNTYYYVKHLKREDTVNE